MQTRDFALPVLGLAALMISACDSDPAPPPATGSLASTQPSSWVSTTTLGTPADPVRGVGARVPQFEANETIVLQVDATGAPANSKFTATWFGPDGRELGRQVLSATMGQNLLSFTAPGAGAIDPGDHRVTLSADGRQIVERPFSVVAERKP